MKVLPMHFYTMPKHASTVMDFKDLNELLIRLDGWVTANGEIYDIKSRSLGVGAYKVWLKKR